MSASGGEEVVSQTSAEVRVWTLAHAAKPYADIVCSAACLYVQRALVLATVNHWRDIYIIRRIPPGTGRPVQRRVTYLPTRDCDCGLA